MLVDRLPLRLCVTLDGAARSEPAWQLNASGNTAHTGSMRHTALDEHNTDWYV